MRLYAEHVLVVTRAVSQSRLILIPYCMLHQLHSVTMKILKCCNSFGYTRPERHKASCRAAAVLCIRHLIQGYIRTATGYPWKANFLLCRRALNTSFHPGLNLRPERAVRYLVALQFYCENASSFHHTLKSSQTFCRAAIVRRACVISSRDKLKPDSCETKTSWLALGRCQSRYSIVFVASSLL